MPVGFPKGSPAKPRFTVVNDGTIYDSKTAERPAKRARGEENGVKVSAAAQMPVEDGNLVIDEVYYKEDGDCFIRVQDTLFKVHSGLLVMSPTITQKLTSNQTWTNRETPFRLGGTSLDEFRALMWARYASHDDVKDQPKDLPDLLRLLHLAAITRRHTFNELLKWTLKAIYVAFTAEPPKLPTCSSDLFQKMAEVVKECDAPDLLDAVISKWSEAVKKKEVSPLPAMETADTWGLRGLRGTAYYVYLQDRLREAKEANDEESATSPTSAFRLDLHSKLQSKQQLALLSGHISLSKFWEKRRRTPLPLLRSSGCTSHDNCIDTWIARWRSAGWAGRVQDLHSSDVLAILAVMCKIMEEDRDVLKDVNEECRAEALDAVRQELCEVRLALPEHFAHASASG